MRRLLPDAGLGPRRPTGWPGMNRACLLVSAGCDAIAAGILLLGTPLPVGTECIAATVAHGCALLLAWSVDAARASRRWLDVAVVATLPGIGVFVVALALSTRGRVPVARRPRPHTRELPILTEDEARRLAGALAPCDALQRGDEDQRLAALSTLSHRADAEAIALLRWAAASRDPERAVSAALVLDHIGEREEREMRRPRLAEVLRGLG